MCIIKGHGKQFNNCTHDNYPDGDPKLKIKDLLHKICEKGIGYYFAGIWNKKKEDTTKKMIEVFNSELALFKTEFEESNDINLKNIAVNQITSYNIEQSSELFQLITTSLTATVINNQTKTLHNDNNGDEYNTVINFDHDINGDYVVLKKTIFQNVNGKKEVNQVVQIHNIFNFHITSIEKSTNGVIKHYYEKNEYPVKDLIGKSAKFLKNKKVNKINLDFSDAHLKEHKAEIFEFKFIGKMEDIKKIKRNYDNKIEGGTKIEDLVKVYRTETNIRICESPFAKGNLRFAYAAKIIMPDNTVQKLVAKNSLYLDPHKDSHDYNKKGIILQLIAKYLAEVFLDEAWIPIKFLNVRCLQLLDTFEFYTIEDFLDGTLKKWNGSLGMINPTLYSSTLVCFSHWVYEKTDNYMIITDLQGFKRGILNNKEEYILTDPAISSVDMAFKPTDLGQYGITKFFEKHECNSYCVIIGLNDNVLLLNGQEFQITVLKEAAELLSKRTKLGRPRQQPTKMKESDDFRPYDNKFSKNLLNLKDNLTRLDFLLLGC